MSTHTTPCLAKTSPDYELSDELVDRLTVTPELDEDVMIRFKSVPETPFTPRDVTRKIDPLKPGRIINYLPLEMVLGILNYLNFASLWRFSLTCVKAKVIVVSMPAWKDLWTHAPHVLIAILKTRMPHPLKYVRQALRSRQCVSCLGLGRYLFLPTCERVCYRCLIVNKALSMTTVGIARDHFHLTEKDLRDIPILYSIRGTYGGDGFYWFSRQRVYRLVSMKQAKELAIKVHGSVENVDNLVPRVDASRTFFGHINCRDVSLEFPSQNLSRNDWPAHNAWDNYPGMGSIRLPLLDGDRIDREWLCRGCSFTSTLESEFRLPSDILWNLVPPRCDPSFIFSMRRHQMYTSQEFLDHLKTCYGTWRLLMKWEERGKLTASEARALISGE